MYRGSPPPVSVVWLGAVPFITIVAASVETYKKECCGLLLGYRSWSHWDKTRRALVEQAYQFQTSKRSRYSVTVPREESRCKEMIYKLSMFEPLGYFHSRPESEPTPTKEDIKSMKVNDVELIKRGAQKTQSFSSGMNGLGLNSRVLKNCLGCSLAVQMPEMRANLQ